MTDERRAADRRKYRERKARDRAQMEARERRASSAPLRVPMRYRDGDAAGERSVPLSEVEELRRDVEEDHEPAFPDEPPPGWAEP